MTSEEKEPVERRERGGKGKGR